MTLVATKTSWTPEDLLVLPDAVHYELVDGELVERGMGTKSSWVGGELHARLREFCKPRQLGWIFPADQSYQCFAHAPDRVRKPDVSFIAAGRMPGEKLPEGHTRIAPDLAAEVISPNDLVTELDQKLRDYMAGGVKLVWVINPDLRTARVHRAGRPTPELQEADELDGEDVLPGFRCRLGDLFPPESA